MDDQQERDFTKARRNTKNTKMVSYNIFFVDFVLFVSS